MLLKTKGKPLNILKPIVAKVTRNAFALASDLILIIDNQNIGLLERGFKVIITTHNLSSDRINTPYVHSITSLEHLREGDIIVVNTDGIINTLYRAESNHNFILVTERCNSNCLMCSQPPKDKDDIDYLFEIHKQLIPLIPKNCFELGITGGEPTLMGNSFFELLELIKYELPETEVHCLTNGRSFAWRNIADRLGALDFNRLMLGIPLYSDYYLTHDYIVQAKDAFNQTIQGLYNLAANNQRIEIRVVLQQQSIPRLVKLAKFIYKNLPFVEHIAFMGLENLWV